MNCAKRVNLSETYCGEPVSDVCYECTHRCPQGNDYINYHLLRAELGDDCY